MLYRGLSLYKTSFTGLSKETWLLSLIMLINRSGTMVVPFMTLYLTGKTMNRTLGEAGTVMGLFGLGAVAGAYFGGRVTDKIGFYKVQIYSLFFGGFMFMVLGQVKDYALICICTFILSFVNEAFRPANSSAIAFYSTPENRTRSYSLNRLAINLGWAVGSSIGGLIASFNYELLFWIDGITNIGAAFLLLYILKPQSKAATTMVEVKEISKINSPYRDRTYLWFVLLVMLFALSFFQLFTTIPKYFRDNLFLSEKFIGLLMALNGLLIVAFEMVMIFYMEKKNKYTLYIPIGVFICALSYFALLIPGNAKAVTFLMIFLITIGEIMCMPFMNTYWTLRSNEQNRGQYAALYTMAWGMAQTLGPFLCALLVEASSFKVLFLVLGTIGFAITVGFFRLHKIS